MARNRTKTRKAKKTAKRPQSHKRRPAAVSVKKSVKEMSRQLDQTVREFDGAAEGLQISLEKLRGVLPELVEVEVRRDRLRRMKQLAVDGILDSLQRLATALEEKGRMGGLPESLIPIHRSARMGLDHLCRAFEIQTVYLPGESLTVAQEQVKDFDWIGDHASDRSFPVQVQVVRSGWKAGDAVFVLPRARILGSGSADENGDNQS